MSVEEDEQVFVCYGCGAKGSVIDMWALFEGVSVKEAFSQIESHLGVHREKPVQTRPSPAKVEKPEKTSPPSGEKKLVKTYDYKDEKGELLFQVCRFEPKDFRQRHMDGGEWKWNLNGVRRVLYNLADVLSSDTAIYFCEGEKDADLLHGMGLCATTVPMGAGKWDDAYTAAFKAKTVVILPDNDAAGEKHCKILTEKLGPVTRAVYIVNVPSPHKDVSDWRKDFSSDAEFGMKLLEESRKAKVVAGADTLPIYDMEEMEARYAEEINRPSRVTLSMGILAPTLGKAIRPLIAGEFATILADTGVGKTFILQNIAMNYADTPILMFEMELPETLMFERFASMSSGAKPDSVEEAYRQKLKIGWRRGLRLRNLAVCPKSNLTCEDIRKLIIQSEMKFGKSPGVVMIDYIGLIRGPGSSRYERLSAIAEDLKTIAKETGTVIITTSQVSRKNDDSPDISLHDAKDSGSIENSSGLILGAWRDTEDAQRIWIKILKNTKGKPGLKVPCRFNPENLQIHEEYGYCENTESEPPQNGSGRKYGSSYPPRRTSSR